ncbi:MULTISPECIES: hypothetical protein [unclassified Micromonospora]|uniref:hypothetical protein n=1 Tax=Micromonospora TaxID=1873 RepID=UPI002FF358CB
MPTGYALHRAHRHRRLHLGGHLGRRVDPLDRRRIRAYLTTRGRREHARLDERVRTSLAEAGVPAGTALLDHLADLIARLDPAGRRDNAEAADLRR